MEPRAFLQLTGPNGSGKTSLLRILCGLLTPESGEVTWKGAPIRSLGEDLPTRFLSEGQRRRSALARLINSSAPLWLLDEVVASLDKAAVLLIESVIGDHLSRGGMAIVATHQELHISAGSFQRLELAS